MRTREDSAGQTLPFANQPKKQVLGFNRDASELARFVASKKQDPPCALCVPLEHLLFIIRYAQLTRSYGTTSEDWILLEAADVREAYSTISLTSKTVFFGT